MEAWRDLIADRGDMGGPIPWTAISCWCADHGITGDERLRTIRLVRACDMAHLEATRKARGSG